MSDWTPRDQWPQWLQDAETTSARVRIVDGIVHWHGGVWHGGIWHGGVWHGGIWYDGVWHGGVWHGGVWHGGVWHGGVWHGGESGPRSKYRIVTDGDQITIGCKSKTISEWDAWFDGTEEYDTHRDTDAFALIRAHYLAVRAYVLALKGAQ